MHTFSVYSSLYPMKLYVYFLKYLKFNFYFINCSLSYIISCWQQWKTIFNFAFKIATFYSKLYLWAQGAKIQKRGSRVQFWPVLGTFFVKNVLFLAPTQKVVEGGSCHTLSLSNIIPHAPVYKYLCIMYNLYKIRMF